MPRCRDLPPGLQSTLLNRSTARIRQLGVTDCSRSGYVKAPVRTEANSTGSEETTCPPGKFMRGMPRRSANATAVRWGNSPFDAVPPATMSRAEVASRAGKSGW